MEMEPYGTDVFFKVGSYYDLFSNWEEFPRDFNTRFKAIRKTPCFVWFRSFYGGVRKCKLREVHNFQYPFGREECAFMKNYDGFLHSITEAAPFPEKGSETLAI